MKVRYDKAVELLVAMGIKAEGKDWSPGKVQTRLTTALLKYPDEELDGATPEMDKLFEKCVNAILDEDNPEEIEVVGKASKSTKEKATTTKKTTTRTAKKKRPVKKARRAKEEEEEEEEEEETPRRRKGKKSSKKAPQKARSDSAQMQILRVLAKNPSLTKEQLGSKVEKLKSIECSPSTISWAHNAFRQVTQAIKDAKKS